MEEGEGRTRSGRVTAQDTYALTHMYTSSIEPGVNAYTVAGYANNDPNAIYDGSGGANSDIALYPDLGEDAADLGAGAPTAIIVHAWNGLGTNVDWNLNAFIGGVLIAVDSTPPVDIHDISTDYGITYGNINKDQNQTIYWNFTGGGGVYEMWFDRDNDTPGNPGLTFVAEVLATTANTQQNNGDEITPNWVAFNGTWTENVDYRTTITFPDPASVTTPVGRIEDLGGGPIQYDYQAFPAFQVINPVAFEENFEGTMSKWTLSGSTGDRGMDYIISTSYLGRTGYINSFSGGAVSTAKFLRYNTTDGGYGSGAIQYGNSCNRTAQANFTLTPGTSYTLTYYTRGMTEGNYDGFGVGLNTGNGSYTWSMPGTVYDPYGYWSGRYCYTGYSSYAPGIADWTYRQYNFTATGTNGSLQLWFGSDSSWDWYCGPCIDEIKVS